MNSTQIYGPLTKLQCSPTSTGAAAAVLVSEKFLEARPHLKSQVVLMAGQSMQTDPVSTYSGSAMDIVGFQMTQRAVKAALNEARLTPQDVKVCELHDCFSANEMILLDAIGFSGTGKAHEMVRRGDITYGGKGPIINPSGGLISKGHPLGATGLAQCAELVWQLRGWANNRLVDKADIALQHNLGLGGAVVVTVYKRMDGGKAKRVSDEDVKKMTQVGYNPAVEARSITPEQIDRVRSKVNRDDHVFADTAARLSARI